jgi:hypothetical protein
MRILTNEKLVEKNKKTATRLFFFSLAILGVGFIVANGQLLGIEALQNINAGIYFTLMPFVLLVGFITTLISVRMTNLWIRVPRPEDAIQLNLKGLSNKSALYNYLHLPARHILICPQGIFAITTRYQEGRFAVKGRKWRTIRSPIGALFSIFRMDSLGNPTVEAEDAARHISRIIEDYDPDIEVQPVIIFVSERVDLEIEDPTIPIFYADPKRSPNFKDYLRDIQKSGQMKGPDDLETFIEDFENATLDFE